MGRNAIVCVMPLPREWSAKELTERFHWYGDLAEANVEFRMRVEGPEEDDNEEAAVWLLGVLRFSNGVTARDVVKRELGGISGKGCTWPGVNKRQLGWASGVVRRYDADVGVGLMGCDSAAGQVHLRVPEDLRAAFAKAKPGKLNIEASVEVGSDGFLQATEMRIREDKSAEKAKVETKDEAKDEDDEDDEDDEEKDDKKS